MALEVLVVDDEADIRELVSGVLEDEGYTVRTAADSTAALEAIDELRRRGGAHAEPPRQVGGTERRGGSGHVAHRVQIRRVHPHPPAERQLRLAHGDLQLAQGGCLRLARAARLGGRLVGHASSVGGVQFGNRMIRRPKGMR